MHLLAFGTCVCSRVNESDIGTRPLHNKLSVEVTPQQGSMGSRVCRLEDLRGPEGTRGCKQMECGDPTRKQNTFRTLIGLQVGLHISGKPVSFAMHVCYCQYLMRNCSSRAKKICGGSQACVTTTVTFFQRCQDGVIG